MSTLALRVDQVSKIYSIRSASGESRVLRRGRFETFRALDCVSLDVHRGEVVGVIGRNGAGKSTLLKVLSRITEPSSGVVELYGKVGSLLEVGTGFHPELTGRENIYLNGAILGMRRREIDARFDEIVAFAEVDRFLDTPVKRYSSGMYVRLAFAVAAHLNPDILIVDEVLAVGDEQFQRKCLGKMQEVSQRDGRTVLFVSHNMAAVKSLCSRAILLSGGKIVTQGSAANVVTEYLKGGDSEEPVWSGSSSEGIHLTRAYLAEPNSPSPAASVDAYGAYRLVCEAEFSAPHSAVRIDIALRDVNGRVVSLLGALEEGLEPVAVQKRISVTFNIPYLPLPPGPYSADATVWSGESAVTFEKACTFEVQPTVAPGATIAYAASHGAFRVARSGSIILDDRPCPE